MKKGTVLLATMLALSMPVSGNATTPNDERVIALEKQVSELTKNLAVLEASLRWYWEEEREQAAELDPANKGFSTIRTPMGLLFLTLEDVSPYADGIEIHLNIGNTTSAELTTVELSMHYGERQPAWSADTNAWLSRKKQWEDGLGSYTETLSESLKPGMWTPVKVRLPQMSTSQLGYVKVKLQPFSASLRTSSR